MLETNGRSIREGQMVLVRPIPWPEDLLPWWCQGQGIIRLHQWYHWLDRAVLCWAHTDYSFTDEWPASPHCPCIEQPQMAATLRAVTACAVWVADMRISAWAPTVLLLPDPVLPRLHEMLKQCDTVAIEKRQRRHLLRVCNKVYPAPEMTRDPVQMLHDFAAGQVRYSLVYYPPVVGRKL